MSIEIIHPCKCKPVVADLLEALKGLYDYGYLISWDSDTPEDLRVKSAARAAIARAEGGTK